MHDITLYGDLAVRELLIVVAENRPVFGFCDNLSVKHDLLKNRQWYGIMSVVYERSM